jgi:hypothetical protein
MEPEGSLPFHMSPPLCRATFPRLEVAQTCLSLYGNGSRLDHKIRGVACMWRWDKELMYLLSPAYPLSVLFLWPKTAESRPPIYGHISGTMPQWPIGIACFQGVFPGTSPQWDFRNCKTCIIDHLVRECGRRPCYWTLCRLDPDDANLLHSDLLYKRVSTFLLALV